MYHRLNYIVYRRIIGYYSGERDEDAFGKILKELFEILYFCLLDMRKALSRDVDKKSLISIPHPVRPEDLVDD
jgi:N-terminal acetyltransferase B complex catalytic subunit